MQRTNAKSSLVSSSLSLLKSEDSGMLNVSLRNANAFITADNLALFLRFAVNLSSNADAASLAVANSKEVR